MNSVGLIVSSLCEMQHSPDHGSGFNPQIPLGDINPGLSDLLGLNLLNELPVIYNDLMTILKKTNVLKYLTPYISTFQYDCHHVFYTALYAAVHFIFNIFSSYTNVHVVGMHVVVLVISVSETMHTNILKLSSTHLIILFRDVLSN